MGPRTVTSSRGPRVGGSGVSVALVLRAATSPSAPGNCVPTGAATNESASAMPRRTPSLDDAPVATTGGRAQDIANAQVGREAAKG
jgi:hypothetical protein